MRDGMTLALPPPWMMAASAFGPITAIERTRSRDSGSSPRSFFSSVMLSRAMSTAMLTMTLAAELARGTAHRIHHAGAEQRAQHAPDVVVELLDVDLRVADGTHEHLAVVARGARHLQVEARIRRFDRRVNRAPVRHHHAVEAPLAASAPCVSSRRFSVMNVPLSRLYELIIVHGCAWRTIISNGAR